MTKKSKSPGQKTPMGLHYPMLSKDDPLFKAGWVIGGRRSTASSTNTLATAAPKSSDLKRPEKA